MSSIRNWFTPARWAALVFSVVALALATGPGIASALGRGQALQYSPETAVLTATLIAIIWYTAYTYESLGEWKDQLSTQASFEAAKALRVASEQFSRDLRDFQSPVFRQREDPTAGGLADPESRLTTRITELYEKRSNRLRDSVEELEVAVVEAAAVWGEEELLTQSFRHLEDQLQRLQANLNYHLHSLGTPEFRADVPEQDDAWLHATSALWGEEQRPDSAGQQIREELEVLRDAADERLSL